MAMIDGIGPTTPVRTIRRAAGTPVQGGFSVASTETSAGEAPLAGGALAVGMETMLALQGELDPATERDRAGRRHGQSLLAALAALQRILLTDGQRGAGSALAQLNRLLTDLPGLWIQNWR